VCLYTSTPFIGSNQDAEKDLVAAAAAVVLEHHLAAEEDKTVVLAAAVVVHRVMVALVDKTAHPLDLAAADLPIEFASVQAACPEEAIHRDGDRVEYFSVPWVDIHHRHFREDLLLLAEVVDSTADHLDLPGIHKEEVVVVALVVEVGHPFLVLQQLVGLRIEIGNKIDPFHLRLVVQGNLQRGFC